MINKIKNKCKYIWDIALKNVLIVYITLLMVCICILLELVIASFYINAYADIKEYKGISILYSEEFNTDINHTYQVVAATDVNVREGPGIEYKVFTVFEKGKPIDNIVLGEEYPKNKWIKFWYGMNYYYIYDDYLKVIRRNISRTNG